MINNYKKYLKYKQKYVKLKGGMSNIFNFFENTCGPNGCKVHDKDEDELVTDHNLNSSHVKNDQTNTDDEIKELKKIININKTNKFTLLKYKTEGGFGIIYDLVEKSDDGYYLIIKILTVNQKDFVKKLNLELTKEIIPEIIDIIDFKDKDSKLFNKQVLKKPFDKDSIGIVQKFYNEGNLGQYLINNPSLDANAIKNIEHQLVVLVNKLYNYFFCGDIKTENVVVNKNQNKIELKLIDFDDSNCQYKSLDIITKTRCKFFALIMYYAQTQKQLFKDLCHNIKFNIEYLIKIVDELNLEFSQFIFSFNSYLLYFYIINKTDSECLEAYNRKNFTLDLMGPEHYKIIQKKVYGYLFEDCIDSKHIDNDNTFTNQLNDYLALKSDNKTRQLQKPPGVFSYLQAIVS